MIKEAIILAGGLGTRLRSVVNEVPKCLAPVAGKPFLYHVINYLKTQGIKSFIFAVGYKHEMIESFVSSEFPDLIAQFNVEEELLGTGGAIKACCELSKEKHVIALNGDTLYQIDLKALSNFHINRNSTCTLSLKTMDHFDRYGVVTIDNNQHITAFHEKKQIDHGLINGGIYAIDVHSFLRQSPNGKFSFEKDFLEPMVINRNLSGFIQDSYFIDIGIPEDFAKANKDLHLSQSTVFSLKNINSSWTLFLDRDGVINHEKPGDYIRSWDEFIFYDGVLEAMAVFAKKFNYIFVVTNQRGVGKKLMTEEALKAIHGKMQEAVAAAGGRIDHVFYCTSLENDSVNRKPNPGMGNQAAALYPEVKLHQSIILGNNKSDMQFGKNIQAKNIFISTTSILSEGSLADYSFPNLLSFANCL